MYCFLTIENVCAITGLTKWTVYNRVRKKTFPEPRRITSRTSRWYVEEIVKWMAENQMPILCDIEQFTLENVRKKAEAEKVSKPSTYVAEPLPEVTLENDPLTSEEIVSRSINVSPNAETCGIYFLIDEDNIVYVGQTKLWVVSRIIDHMVLKKFDRFFFVACPRELLDVIETYYIYKFRPRDNGKMKHGFSTVAGRRDILTEKFKADFDQWLAGHRT